MQKIFSNNIIEIYKGNKYYISYKENDLVCLAEHIGVSEEQLNKLILNDIEEKTFFKKLSSFPKLIDKKNNKVILYNLQEAQSKETAFTGLLNQKGILKGEGLLIHNCQAIHMLGMKFSINAYFLDRGMNVIAKFLNIPIGSQTPLIQNAYFTLETNISCDKITVGDKLDILYPV